MALQIAVLLGARPIVTSGSDAKLETALRLGAGVAVNHGVSHKGWLSRRVRSGFKYGILQILQQLLLLLRHIYLN